MPPQYDILSKDILDDSDNDSSSSNGGKKDDKGNNHITIPPIVVHIIIILFLLGIVGLLYFVFFSSSEETEKEDLITFVGQLKNFDREYDGNMTLSLSSFLLITNAGNFSENSKNVEIKNFSGRIYYENKSLNFVGTGNTITFDRNVINLRGSEFKIVSSRKTNIDLSFDEIALNFTKGRAKVNNDLNFEFEKGTVNITNFDSSFNFDGVFSITGTADSFKLDAPQENLYLEYNNK